MNVSPESIIELLNTLVSPEFYGIKRYEVSYETDNDMDETWCIVNVIFNSTEFHKEYDKFAYDYIDEFEDDVVREVKGCLKYFNIYRSIVEIYVESED